ncbi:MAG: MFS transporter [Defluviitaleaceae bacterium]|nr:MFS transporter [Defluviitaleaceae bacterium]
MKKSWFLLLAIYGAFLAIGMPDGALGVALPDIRFDVGLSRGQASAIMIVHSLSYALAAAQTSRLEKFLKLKWVTGGGIFLLLAGILGYSVSPVLAGFIVSTVALGAGMGLVDTGANAFAVDHLSAKHMNHLHCFWAMGGAISPLIMRQMIIYYDWRMGYMAIFAVQFVIAIILMTSILRGMWEKSAAKRAETGDRGDMGTVPLAPREPRQAKETVPLSPPFLGPKFQYMQIFIFFIYVAFELSVTVWTVDVLLNSPRRDVVFETAGLFPAVYLGALMAGRFIFGYVAEKFSGISVIRIGFFIAAVGLIALVFTSNIVGIAFVGFGFAPIFPCLMNETKKRFGSDVLSKLVGLQIAAAGAGAAIGSFTVGQILEHVSIDAFFPVIIAMVAVAFVFNETIERAFRKV